MSVEKREKCARAAEGRVRGFRDLRTLLRGNGPTRSGRLALDVLARREASEKLRLGRVERLSSLQRTYGRARCESFLMGSGLSQAHVDLDVLESMLVLADLDVAVESAVERVGLDAEATRWGRALKALPEFMYEAVLQALHAEYKERAADVLASPWSQEWPEWDMLVAFVQSAVEVRGTGCLYEDDVLDNVQRLLRAHVRLSVQNASVAFLSDGEQLANLHARGLSRGVGEIFLLSLIHI